MPAQDVGYKEDCACVGGLPNDHSPPQIEPPQYDERKRETIAMTDLSKVTTSCFCGAVRTQFSIEDDNLVTSVSLHEQRWPSRSHGTVHLSLYR
jgi:hypothetical protein